ncbi:cobaltochelatase CobS [Desulfacinum hydrothermale DSM 13146]|uniref:Cobaltochelatase CobS n=1 Tax=Desulfacinum hydrothermale DSM 13146 TaxID=1121390 RepID=A0A1W1XVY5_9BACT|nr:MoxR family ATPase [Desulfacinum hydrothermale]SMC28086.1 cobaltochelatase CobS [Desulfacinum hydrothermale DSM 13146]
MEQAVADLFGVNIPKSITVKCWDSSDNPFVPHAEDYKFRLDLLRDYLAWWKIGENEGLYLTGPTGSGKTSLVLQAAARMNVPVYRATGHARLELADLVGHYVVNDSGGMVFEYGPLSRAVRDGGIFLFDEIDAADPSVLVGLNSILDGSPLQIPEKGGEIIPVHQQFRFVATGNTNGGGDESGEYAGTQKLNMAFLDRFWMLTVSYPDKQTEVDLLESLGIVPQIGEKFVEVANLIRQQFLSDEYETRINITMSTRTLVRWVKLALFFKKRSDSVYYALERALLMRASARDREAVQELVQRVFGN